MKNFNNLWVLILMVGLILSGCGGNTANSADPSPASPTEDAGEVVPRTGETDPAGAEDEGVEVITQPDFQLVSTMLDATIYDSAGEEIGRLVDLAFDNVTGYVAYIIMEPHQDLETGGDFVAFPWAALGSAEAFLDQGQEGQFEAFTYTLDRSLLTESPALSRSDMTERGLELWSPELYNYWAAVSDAGLITGLSDVTVMTQLSGYETFNVIEGSNRTVLPLEDVIIGLGTGEVAYFVVPVDEIVPDKEGFLLIPYGYLSFATLEDGTTGYVFNATEDVLAQLPIINQEQLDSLRP